VVPKLALGRQSWPECRFLFHKLLLILWWRYSLRWALACFTIRLQASPSPCLSLYSFIPIFLWSVDTSSNHLIFGLPIHLVAYSFPYNIFFWNCSVLHSFYVTKPLYSLSFNEPHNVLPLNYRFYFIVSSNFHYSFSFNDPYIFRNIFLPNTANALSSSMVSVHDSET